MGRLTLLLLIIGLVASGCSVFGIRTAEELEYTVLQSANEVELRQYAPYVSAEASVDGTLDTVQGDLFRVLAGYIFGKNTKQQDIAMTAPVVMEPTADLNETDESGQQTNGESESIAMTAPVTMAQSEDGVWTMAFSMPSSYTMDTLPKPLDKRVTLVQVPQRTVAVFEFSGFFDNEDNRSEGRRVLSHWLKNNPSYRAVGRPFYAGYDPPFTLPFLRRNEVLLTIEAI